MNKETKTILIIFAVLFSLGISVMFITAIASGWDINMFNTTKYEEKEYVITDEFDDIHIDASSEDIDILRSNDGTVRIVTYESEHLKYDVEVNGGCLNVILNDIRKWYEFFGISFGRKGITVYLPEDIYGNITVKNTSGSIDISDLSVRGAVVMNTSGMISVNSFKSLGAVIVGNTSGSIKLTASTASEITVSNTSGKTEFNSVHADYDINIKSTSGSVTVKNSTTWGDIEIDITSGLTKIISTVAGDGIIINSKSGNVALEESDACIIDIDTVSGNVDGTLLSSKAFVCTSKSGNIMVPDSVWETGACQVNTVSGNIIFKVISE